jgi:hypothetical protein
VLTPLDLESAPYPFFVAFVIAFFHCCSSK